MANDDLGERRKRPAHMRPRPVTQDYGEEVEPQGEEEKAEGKQVAKCGQTGPGTVTTEIYQRMYVHYKERQSAHHVWKKLREEGVRMSERTVSRALFRGYPERGLQPIAERYKRILENCYAKQDYDAAAFRTELVKDLRTFYRKIGARIERFTDEDLDKLNPVQLANVLDTVAKNMANIGFKMNDLVGEESDQFEGWTREQKLEFLKSGKWPEVVQH